MATWRAKVLIQFNLSILPFRVRFQEHKSTGIMQYNSSRFCNLCKSFEMNTGWVTSCVRLCTREDGPRSKGRAIFSVLEMRWMDDLTCFADRKKPSGVGADEDHSILRCPWSCWSEFRVTLPIASGMSAVLALTRNGRKFQQLTFGR